MSTFSEMVEYKKDRIKNTFERRVFLKHNSKVTRSILEQEMLITGDLSTGVFKAQVIINDFPDCGSEKEAALKLANWLQRLGAVIEDGYRDE